MSKLWNITCHLCKQEINDTKDWVKLTTGSSYHKKCYEAAIREMTRFIFAHTQPRKPGGQP